jgi:hypothetical protein
VSTPIERSEKGMEHREVLTDDAPVATGFGFQGPK